MAQCEYPAHLWLLFIKYPRLRLRLEVHARIDGIAGGAYLTRKSWPSAKSNYAKAIRENDIRVKPLPGSPFDQ